MQFDVSTRTALDKTMVRLRPGRSRARPRARWRGWSARPASRARWARRSEQGRVGGMLRAFAVGAGVAYFLDPDRGRLRRARFIDRAGHLRRTASAGAATAQRDLANRFSGLLADVRERARPAEVDDLVLAERVRAALGRSVPHAGAVDVTVEDGVVTLSGYALAQEAPDILSTVRAVRGVRDVHDRLEIRRDAGSVSALQSPGRAPGSKPDILQENWAPGTRLLAIVAGAAAAVAGVARGGVIGPLSAAGGAVLALRGATNLSLGRLLGVAGGRRGIDITKTIEIDAPVEVAFGLWDRFEEFPRFMAHVRSVERRPDGTSHWVIGGPGGAPIEFDARLTKHVANEVIAWKSVDGEAIRHSGIARFEPRAANRSRINVRLTYNPPGGILAHAVATALGSDPKKALDDDLVRFQSLVTAGRTTADGRTTTVGEIAPDVAAWSPVAAGAGMSSVGVNSEALAEQRATHEAEEAHEADAREPGSPGDDGRGGG